MREQRSLDDAETAPLLMCACASIVQFPVACNIAATANAQRSNPQPGSHDSVKWRMELRSIRRLGMVAARRLLHEEMERMGTEERGSGSDYFGLGQR